MLSIEKRLWYNYISKGVGNMSPKSVKTVCLIMLFLGCFVAMLAARADIAWLVFAGVTIMAASIFLHIVFYRCPYCGRYLDRSGGNYCPYCGKSID